MVNSKSGIYKITSLSGRVYIGQAVNIKSRYSRYKNPNCTNSQVRLKNSFNKYGFDKHIFEVVENCDKCDLNNRERYWQDFYNVLDNKTGLNCVLQNTEDKPRIVSKATIEKGKKTAIKNGSIKRGVDNNKSKLVLSLETGVYYDNLVQACEALNLGYDTTRNKVRNNKSTKLIYAYNFEKEVVVTDGRTTRLKSSVIDTTTGKVYKSIYEASNILDIPYNSLCSMLRGITKNNTDLKILTSDVSKYKLKTKAKPKNSKTTLCLTTGIYYDSLKDACDAMNKHYGTAQVYMRVNKIKDLSYV